MLVFGTFDDEETFGKKLRHLYYVNINLYTCKMWCSLTIDELILQSKECKKIYNSKLSGQE